MRKFFALASFGILALVSASGHANDSIRMADLEIHTSTLSERQLSDIGHYIMNTFVDRIPNSMMVYVSDTYDIRLDVYITKTGSNYSTFVQVFNKSALQKQMLDAGVSEDQIKLLLEGKQKILASNRTFWTVGTAQQMREDLSNCIDDIATTIMPNVEGSITRLEKSRNQANE